jgi:hypothetical protein
MVIWELVDKDQLTVPETLPRTTTRRMPVGTEAAGTAELDVTTTVSALEAHRPS